MNVSIVCRADHSLEMLNDEVIMVDEDQDQSLLNVNHNKNLNRTHHMRVPSNFSISMSDRYCESKIHHEIDMSMLRLVETSVVMDGIVQIDEISIQTIKQGFSITNMTYFLIGCFFLAIKIF